MQQPENQVDLNMEIISVLGSRGYIMSVAFLTAMRNEDPATKIGACIVNKYGKIVGIGCNKRPRNFVFFETKKMKTTIGSPQSTLNALQPEMDAILNKDFESLKDYTMSSLVLSYSKFEKLIVDSAIEKLVYYVDKYSTTNNKKYICIKKIFDEANMEWKAFQPRHKETAKRFLVGGWIKIQNFEN